MSLTHDDIEDPLGALAEEYLDRLRRGSHPSVREYCERHPELAERIAELFPTMALLEGLASHSPSTGDSSLPQAPPPHVLDDLDDYRVLRELGRGGMGIVYEAEQRSLGRRVAIKVLPPQATLDATRAERFEREARAVARLHHTNIVPIFHVGEHQGLRYYVMQYIRGQGLDQVLRELARQRSAAPTARETLAPTRSAPRRELDSQRRRPASDVDLRSADSSCASPAAESDNVATAVGPAYWKSVARIGVQVADALGYANSQGILHRDIKPSNLLLDELGAVWITDFGLAKLTESHDLTRSGDVVGTLRYLAPERLLGKEDVRGDIYSLGATLYELLTLRPPFSDEDRPRLLRCLTDEEPRRPRSLDASIPRDLETIVLKAMAKSPDDRYQSTEQLADDLRQFLHDKPVSARRIGWAERTWRWCRRNPVVATLTVLVFGLLTTLTIVFALGSIRLSAAERAARLRLAEALIGDARGVRTGGREGRRFAALATLSEGVKIGRELELPPAWFDRPRNEAIAALALPDLYLSRTWPGWTPDTRMTAVSADFQVYARVDRVGAVTIRRLADDTELARLAGRNAPCRVALSADGRDVVRFHDFAESGHPQGEAEWFRVADGGMRLVRLVGLVHEALFLERAEGNRLICLEDSGAIGVYDVGTGQRETRTSEQEELHGARVDAHPTGPWLALTSYRSNQFLICDYRTGEVVAREIAPWPNGCRAAWHPDGRRLYVANTDQERSIVFRWDGAARRLTVERSLPHGHFDGILSFNRRGDRVLQSKWDETVRVWDYWTGDSLFESRHSRIAGNWPIAAKWNAEETSLALARPADDDRALGIWSIATGREYRRIQPPKGRQAIGRFAVHPGGRWAVQSELDGMHFYDVPTGAHLGVLAIPALDTDLEQAVCFDRGGRLFASSREGVFRWDVKTVDDRTDRWQIGPPTRLPLAPGWHAIKCNDDGSVVGQAMWNGYGMEDYAGGWCLHPASPLPRWFAPRKQNNVVAVSPDGKWVISDASNEVCDAATGVAVWKLPVGAPVRFSRSGRYLLTHGGRSRAYATGDWTSGPDLGPGLLWDCTNDDRLAVLSLSNGSFRLVEMTSGRELARLEDPEQDAREAEFSPDGTLLFARAITGFRVWDLRRIRRELSKLDLDWDAAPYPPEPPTDAFVSPIELDFVGAEDLDPSRLGQGTALVEIAVQYAATNATSDDQRQAWRLVHSHLHAADSSADLAKRIRQDTDASRDVVSLAEKFAETLKFDKHVRALEDARQLQLHRLHEVGRWTELAERVAALRVVRPHDPILRGWAGYAAALRGDYAASSAHFAASSERSLDGEEADDFTLAVAASALLAAEPSTYAALRTARSGLDSRSMTAAAAADLARLLTLAPASVEEANAAGVAARRAVDASPTNPDFLHALGLVHLRQGDVDQAEESFRRSLAADASETVRVADWLGLALACARANRPARAELWLLQAQEWLDAHDREATDGRPATWICSVPDRLVVRLLRREAERAVDAATP